MNMHKEGLVKLVCSGYCSFYKTGKDEELACRGFTILEKLLDVPKEVPARTERPILSLKAEDGLFRLICLNCPFFALDCDFASWKRGEDKTAVRETVNPCGGFLCLGHYLDHGAVDIQDVNRVI